MAEILVTGYESVIRSKFGIDEYDLPDGDINQPTVINLAEAIVTRRVPDFASIIDIADTLYLQNATLSYACYLLCPSMYRRLNIEVGTLDTKWKKDKVNWDAMAVKFLSEFEDSLNNITSVEVDSSSSTTTIVGIITRERDPI